MENHGKEIETRNLVVSFICTISLAWQEYCL